MSYFLIPTNAQFIQSKINDLSVFTHDLLDTCKEMVIELEPELWERYGNSIRGDLYDIDISDYLDYFTMLINMYHKGRLNVAGLTMFRAVAKYYAVQKYVVLKQPRPTPQIVKR